MSSGLNHYETLGVLRGATGGQIRGAYRRLARLHHPDVDASAGAAERFAAIANAYQVLVDPDQRRLYDQQLAAEAERRSQAGSGFEPGVPHYNWSNIASRGGRVGGRGGGGGSGRVGGESGRGGGEGGGDVGEVGKSRRPSKTEADEIYETFFVRHDPL